MDSLNSISVNNIPGSKKVELGYRTVANSNEMNVQQEEILSDILDLFNKANRLAVEIEQTKDVVGTENIYLQFRLNDLETKIATLTQVYKNSSSDIKTQICYPNNMNTDGNEYAAFIDAQNMDVTMQHTTSVSKVNIYDEALRATFVPPSLKLMTGPDTLKVDGKIISIEDNDITNAFDGDPNSTWVRKITTDESIDEIVTELIIGLPEDIITTRDINTIVINPYPASAVDITAVEYKQGGSWMSVEAFTAHRKSILEQHSDIFGTTSTTSVINDCPNIKLSFKSIRANQLRITFRQRHYISGDGNVREFYLGAKSIEILQNTYAKEYYTFNAVFDFPEIDKTIAVHNAEVVLNNPSEVPYEIVQYEYYYYDNDDKVHKILESAPFNLIGHKLMVKCKIYNESITPNISMIKVNYKAV